MRRTQTTAAYMIGVVASQFGIHPQTLRMYEREGLLCPSRTEGKTRLYSEDDLERLELILSLTRDLGVNLAGVEVVIQLRERMNQMQHEFERILESYELKMRQAGLDPGDLPRPSSPVKAMGLIKVGRQDLVKRTE